MKLWIVPDLGEDGRPNARAQVEAVPDGASTGLCPRKVMADVEVRAEQSPNGQAGLVVLVTAAPGVPLTIVCPGSESVRIAT